MDVISLSKLNKMKLDLVNVNSLFASTGTAGIETLLNDYIASGLTMTNSMVIGDTRFFGIALTEGTNITQIQTKCLTAGNIVVKLASKNVDGTFNLIQDFAATLIVGENVVPINQIVPLDNCYLGIYQPSSGGATVGYHSGTGYPTVYKFTGELVGVNKTTVAATTTSTIPIKITMVSVATPSNVLQNNKDLNDILLAYSKTRMMNSFSFTENYVPTTSTGLKKLDKYSLLNTTFPSLPSGWVNPGAFTFAGGLKSPATGTTATQCYLDVYSTLDRQTIRARIKITGITSTFALFKRHTLHGGLGLVSLSSMNLKLYKAWTGGALPVENLAVPITIPIVAGRDYIITYTKDANFHSLTIQDAMTGASNTAMFDNCTVTNTNYCGKQWGGPGVMFLSGDITVKKFEYVCNAPKDAKVLILGDSITEGFLLDNNTATYEDRWSALVRKNLNDNCVISGRGSGDTADLITKLAQDLDRFTPKYVILAIGTNDVVLDHNVANFQTNLDILITRVETAGAIPILVCPPTNGSSANMTEMQAVYDYVNAKPYNIIHFNYATSVGNDGVTHDASLSVEGTHPNKAGHLKMYNQVLLEVPEIFE